MTVYYPREGADPDDLVVTGLVKRFSKQDVLPETAGEDPGMLGYKGDLPMDTH